MTNPLPIDPLDATPLLRLHRLHHEVRAGFGNASITVRTLDDVSLSIHDNELVVVSGTVASGARSLIAVAAAGQTRVGDFRGTRTIGARVQVRRASIDESAWQALRRAWVRHPVRAEVGTHHRSRQRARVLYVLRVKPAERHSRHVQVDWSSWIQALRQCGGSVLAHAATASKRQEQDNVIARVGAERVVRESVSPFASAPLHALPSNRSLIRELRVDGGRLINEPEGRIGRALPNACDPYPTASPES